MASNLRTAHAPKSARTSKNRRKKPNTALPKFVIGLGASAGGLEALEEFFDHARDDADAAYIVVMHLSRDFKSMLDGLLARHTAMKVCAAVDGQKIEGNTIYVIQPNTLLEVDQKTLKVDARQNVAAEGVVTAVDALFRSIAQHWAERGAAVVLSGSGSDGAKGIQAVQRAGGFTCAQSPESAKFDPMPIAAIATEEINAVEPPNQLANTIIDGLMLPKVSHSLSSGSKDSRAMARIVDSVIGATTLKAEEYKHSTFARRVSRRMMNLRVADLDEYSDIVSKDKAEAQALCDDLLIGVTEFFRDEQPFKTIQASVIPQIIKRAHEDSRPIRIWVAGCATGQEAYTIAILFREALRDMPFEIDVQIFASDISRKHLDIATKGTYSDNLVSNIPREVLERYFDHNEEHGAWTVIKPVRKMVVFAPHDLLSDPPFTNLDLVTCRNVLIYFSVEAQQRILGGFAFGLTPGGFLFLGSSETIGGQRQMFEFVDGRQRIFRRTQDKVSPRSLRKARDLFPSGMASVTLPARKSTAVRNAELQPSYDAMLAEYAPSSLLFSNERELLHTFGDAHRFLRPPAGLANLDITELVDAALKTPMIVALERSSADNKSLTFNKIALQSNPQAGMLVDLTVRPLMLEGEEKAKQFLAIIDDHQARGADEGGTVQAIDADKLLDNRHTQLEEELSRTREALQSTIEEIETANEELQASNEELMSANEELQSTNEELSSVNEELYTVNAEYHRQNDELSRLTNDFDLLLNATQIGVLFLDDEGQITRFTGLAKTLFNFEESDVGRPVGNFKSPFKGFDAAERMKDAPKEGQIIEIESEDFLGVPWLIRLVSDDANFGVVMTFIDISELRNAETELRQTHRMLEIMRTTSHAYYFECDPSFGTIHSQVGYDEFVGLEDIQLPHAINYEHVHPEDLPILETAFERAADQTSSEFIYRMHSAPHDEFRYVKAIADRLGNGNWQVVATDVDDIYRAELAQREQAAVLEATLIAGRAYKAYILPDKTFGFANDKFCTLFGTSKQDIIGKPISDVLPKQLLSSLTDENVEAILAGENRDDVQETTINGIKLLFSVRYRPVEDNGRVIGFVFDGLNISELSEFADQFVSMDRLLTSSIRNSAQAMMLVSADAGRVTFANRTGRVLLGLKSGEFEEDKFSISRLTPEFSEQSWIDVLGQTVENGTTLLNDMIVLNSGNQLDTVDIYLEADLTREDGGLIAVRVYDNPEKQRLIEGLRERSVRLASSNRDLEQFTSAVAHDLRAPLRHIISFSEILANEAGKLSEEEAKSYSDIVAQSAHNLRNMVGGLLDYARIGLRETEMEPCDLTEVCAAAQRNISGEIASSKAAINIQGGAIVFGNFDLLVALFQNLISNSIKYKKSEGELAVEVEIKNVQDEISVTISDNGIGIKAEFAEKIFELFRRLHSDKDYSGLGIGLTTCRKIAELHKAEITLDRAFQEGSRFILSPLMKLQTSAPVKGRMRRALSHSKS